LQNVLKNDKDYDVRNVASLSLGILGDESAVNNLKAILLDENNTKPLMISRAYAALSLGYIKSNSSIEALKEALKPENKLHEEIQCSALLSLGNIQDKSLIPFLGNILIDTKRNVQSRSYAALALGRIKDAEALPHLKKVLQDRENNIRASVAIALD